MSKDKDKDKVPLGAQLISLSELLADKYFLIPDYQRSYAWDEKQVLELLHDIAHLLADAGSSSNSSGSNTQGSRHYTGTLVLSRVTLSANDSLEYQIVDGQQRLTTLMLILSELSRYVPENERDDFIKLYLLRGSAGNERPVLKLNTETNQYFQRLIVQADAAASQYDEATLPSHARLSKSKQLISTWFKSLSLSDNPAQYHAVRAAIETKLGFLIYAPDDDAETGMMFEVINNRGKPLSELEKVKNYIIYCCAKLQANALREQTNLAWAELLKHLSLAKRTSAEQESAFLRYCTVVHFGFNKTDSQYAYDTLKKRWDPKLSACLNGGLKPNEKPEAFIQSIRAFVTFLEQASYWYQKLFGTDRTGVEPEIKAVLEQIRAQTQHASIMPLLLSLLIKHKGQGKVLLSMLKFLEIINFRVYTAPNMLKRNDSGQGTLYDLAASYYKGSLLADRDLHGVSIGRTSIETAEQGLEYELTAFVMRNAPDTRFEDSFTLEPDNQVDDFYRWSGIRYFLMCYEAHLQPNKTISIDKIKLGRNEGKTSDFLSVEHVWATKNRNNEGENNRGIDLFQKRRLGNFCLLELRLNIQGSNDGIQDKIAYYSQKNSSEPPTDLEHVRKMLKDAQSALNFFSEVKQTKNYFYDLYARICDAQEARYVAFALKRWSIKDRLGYAQLNASRLAEEADE